MIKQTKNAAYLTALFTMVYFVSYLTRINYGAVISEIAAKTGWDKSVASLALTGSAVTYGAGQLLSGFLGDRIQPKRLIFCGLLTTMTTNLLIPLCSSPYQMTAVWAVNGLAQAFMWPPLVKLMANLLSVEEYKRASYFVSCGSAAGTIFVYLLAPVCIYLSGWKSVFLISAICAFFMAFFFNRTCPEVVLKNTGKKADEANAQKLKPSFVIAGIMISVAILGALRDGTMTWLPSYVSENFNLSSEISILTGIVLPLFTVVSYRVTLALNKKIIKNEVLLGGAFFVTGFAAIFVLNKFDISSVVASVLLLAVLNASMHGVNLALITLVPVYFKKYGRVSFVSGLFNSCVYAGSAVSTYGTALVSERFGWGAVTLLWCALAALGAVICFLITKSWSNQKRESI